MSTDRELLEWAAKAAGFGAPRSGNTCWTESEYPRKSGKHGALWNYIGHMDDAKLWNPLTDDGDALRLAVMAGIDITVSGGNTAATSYKDSSCFQEYADGDLMAATRRAIVRAAAEIGKQMP